MLVVAEGLRVAVVERTMLVLREVVPVTVVFVTFGLGEGEPVGAAIEVVPSKVSVTVVASMVSETVVEEMVAVSVGGFC